MFVEFLVSVRFLFSALRDWGNMDGVKLLNKEMYEPHRS
jgi:hypothetical protein